MGFGVSTVIIHLAKDVLCQGAGIVYGVEPVDGAVQAKHSQWGEALYLEIPMLMMCNVDA